MLTIQEDQLLLDGKPFTILSGSIHYFRVVEGYWEDRLRKLKASGLNTVETYIPWNFHEPNKGDFRFSGMRNIEKFIQTAQELDLYVILRPAPYICAEWEMGGLPAWLLKDQKMNFRCADPVFLQHFESYYKQLLPRLARHQYSQGGPVIAFQIENEYGAYGDDKEYLREIKRMYEDHGIRELLFTSDGPDMIRAGSIPELWTTLNFGSRPKEAFAALDAFKPGTPKMCAEYWIGWFDSWGNKHHTRDDNSTGSVFQEMLDMGASVNFYMFHGGTNFHFYNGANHYETYDPTITSYDYDALLTESGDITDKYRAVRKIIGADNASEIPASSPKLPPQTIELRESASIFDTLHTVSRTLKSKAPLSMEEADQAYGYILYRTEVAGKGTFEIDLTPICDRAFIYINGTYRYTYYRNESKKLVELEFPKELNTLEIFVENMGRVNYGKHLKDKKGIVDNLWIDNRYTFDWESCPIELENFTIDHSHNTDTRFPKFFEAAFTVDTPLDTFVRLDGWKKGNVFINGFNLGRYWEIGPQKTLYLPGPLLNKGLNTIQVFELEGNAANTISLVEEPDLG